MAGSLNAPINRVAVQALAHQPLDVGFKGIPARWWGHTSAEIVARAPRFSGEGAFGPVCVLDADAVTHNLAAMASWCRERGVQLAPHGKTHMSPQLATRQLDAGACAISVATIGQAAVYRAFGVRDLVLANELVDDAGLAWLAAELDRDETFGFTCWVDSVRGVELMTAALAGAGRAVDVCVEVGLAGGRSGCRSRGATDEVARAAAASPRLRLVGVAGYEAALGQDLAPAAMSAVGMRLSPRLRLSKIARRSSTANRAAPSVRSCRWAKSSGETFRRWVRMSAANSAWSSAENPGRSEFATR